MQKMTEPVHIYTCIYTQYIAILYNKLFYMLSYPNQSGFICAFAILLTLFYEMYCNFLIWFCLKGVSDFFI